MGYSGWAPDDDNRAIAHCYLRMHALCSDFLQAFVGARLWSSPRVPLASDVAYPGVLPCRACVASELDGPKPVPYRHGQMRVETTQEKSIYT
jgi:hypothetical protein